MKKKIEFGLFWVAYRWNNLVTKFSKKKQNEYLLIVLGRYPTSLNVALKSIVTDKLQVRYSISVNTVIVRFTCAKDFQDLENTLRHSLQYTLDNFVLIEMSDLARNFYSFNMSQQVHNNLFAQIVDPVFLTLDNYRILDEMQMIINTLASTSAKVKQYIKDIRDEVLEEQEQEQDFLKNIQTPEPSPEELEAEVNQILDKIKTSGAESLTEEEKNKLLKYGK